MPTCPSGNSHKTIGAFVYGFAGKSVVDDVMKHNSTARMRRLVHFDPRAQRGDPDRNLVFYANVEITVEAPI